jgi:hypothetical protein
MHTYAKDKVEIMKNKDTDVKLIYSPTMLF